MASPKAADPNVVEQSVASPPRTSRYHALRNKFGWAFRGLVCGMRRDYNLLVHLGIALCVAIVAALLQVSLLEWCLLGLCIAGVLVAEMFNTAIECLAKAITDQYDPRVGQALDMASASVLLSAIGAACVGSAIFIARLGWLLGWW